MRRASDQIEKPMQYQKSFLMAGSALALAMSGAPALADADQTQATNVEDVVVVGSRIRRDVYNSPSPVQVVTREDATLQGYASTAEVLQGTAITGGATQTDNSRAGFTVNGGAGVNTIGLRGMSPTRTLVLLNGRRVSPAGTRGSVGAADLNVLPSAMIERVEVLRDGASSVYGSDAVAGVINLQTRKNFEGLSVEATANVPMDADGAGMSSRLSIVGGLRGANWRLSGAADYFERNEMTLRDRDFTLCNRLMQRNPQTGASLDYIDPNTGKAKCFPTNGSGASINLIGTGTRTGVGAPGAVGTQFNRWRPNSAVDTGFVGWEGVGGTGVNLDVRDSFDDRMLNRSLISPTKTLNLYAEGGYGLNALGDAELYLETMYSRRESYQTGTRQFNPDYAVGSPLLPNSLSWSRYGADEGMSKGKDVAVKAFTLEQNTAHQTVDFQRHVVGLKGDITRLDGWRYDAYLSFARSDAEYRQPQYLKSRLSEALDVVVGPDGRFVCRELAKNPGCVAAPALSAALLKGKVPADFFAYVSPVDIGKTKYEETVLAAGFDGPLWTLPAGQVMAYFGAEYRHASLLDTPSEASRASDILNYTSAGITKGDDSVIEAFGEIDVPLLKDLPMVQDLDLTASYRYTDYDSYGDDTTYKLGLFWKTNDWLNFRASYGTSYRAPALYEQYVGDTSSFGNALLDPCNNFESKDAYIKANCASEGLAPGFTQKGSITVIQRGGAATGLSAETSSNLSLGAVFTPRLKQGWGDLAVAVDYYEIEVNNGVSRLGSANIMNDCYASTPDEFKARTGLCRLISRDPQTGYLRVIDSYVNIATDVVKGLDYNLRYRNDVGPGQVALNVAVSYTPTQEQMLFDDEPAINSAGDIGSPRYSGTADLAYSVDNWLVRWGTEWVGEMSGYERRKLDPATSIYNLRTPNYFLHHLSAQVRAHEWTATVGDRNVFNVNPPEISATSWYSVFGNAPLVSSYDFAGRTAFIKLSRTF